MHVDGAIYWAIEAPDTESVEVNKTEPASRLNGKESNSDTVALSSNLV